MFSSVTQSSIVFGLFQNMSWFGNCLTVLCVLRGCIFLSHSSSVVVLATFTVFPAHYEGRITQWFAPAHRHCCVANFFLHFLLGTLSFQTVLEVWHCQSGFIVAPLCFFWWCWPLFGCSRYEFPLESINGNMQHLDWYLSGITGDVPAGRTTIWRWTSAPPVKSISGNALIHSLWLLVMNPKKNGEKRGFQVTSPKVAKHGMGDGLHKHFNLNIYIKHDRAGRVWCCWAGWSFNSAKRFWNSS